MVVTDTWCRCIDGASKERRVGAGGTDLPAPMTLSQSMRLPGKAVQGHVGRR